MRKKRKLRSIFAVIMAAILLVTTVFPAATPIYAAETGSQPDEIQETLPVQENKPVHSESINLQHEKPQHVSNGEDLSLNVIASNAQDVTVYYKSASISEPVALQMEKAGNGTFTATIPKIALWSSNIEYWFKAGDTKSDIYTVAVEKKTIQDYQALPKLLITEVNLSDATYPFLEIYNNTTETINLDNYLIRFQEKEFSFPENTTIQSGETKVVWFTNGVTTVNHFNTHYESKLTEEQIIVVESNDLKATASTIRIVEKDTNQTEVTATYEQSETAASQLFYSLNIKEMTDGGFTETVQPGELVPGQVPEEKVLIETENTHETTSETLSNEEKSTQQEKTNGENEIIQQDQDQTKQLEDQLMIQHKPITQINGDSNITIEATVPNAANVTVKYQTGDQMKAQQIAMERQEGTDKYVVDIPSTAFWSPTFYYKIIAGDADGTTFTYPENDYIEANVQYKNIPDYQAIPTLLITEITPDTTNNDGSDGYEYIEIYNNTNQPINMNDYRIIYRYPDDRADQTWNLTEDKVIGPQESFIAWIHNGKNNAKTIDDFNAHLNLDLTESHVTILENGGMANGSERTLIVADEFGNEISKATYNDEQDDTSANQGITYKYPSEGTVMDKVGISETITPLEIIPGQAPSEPVVMETDAKTPVIGQPSFDISEKAITVNVEVTSNQKINGVNFYFSQSKAMEFEALPMVASEDNPSIYTISIPREEIWSDRAQYYFVASNQAGETTTEPKEVAIPQPDIDFQAVPPLLITEVAPDTTNSNGADGYEFIEVYNNTTENINFNDYILRYRYPNSGPAGDLLWGPSNDQEVIIPSGETVVFWIINSGNQDKTGADFNANFDSDLTEGTNLIKIHNNGMSNSSERTLVLATKTGYELSYAHYNEEAGTDDTSADKGILYRFPVDGSSTVTKISAGELDATPGTIMPEQVPVEIVQLPTDTVNPVINDTTNKEAVSSEDAVTIRATITDNVQVKSASLYYRTVEGTDFRKVNLERTAINTYEHTIYEPELIGQKELKYYFAASDGRNVVTSKTKIIPIEHPNTETGLRLNVDDNELLSGEKVIKATYDNYTENMNLFLDDEQVTDTFMAMENEAYFAFDVSETNIYFKNGVTMGDEILEIFDETYNEFITLTVPIPADKLQPGENMITIRSGNKVSPFDETSTENRDNFTIKNVRLVLSDGTIIRDPNYSIPDESYSVGDSSGMDSVYDFTFTLKDENFSSLAYRFDTTTSSDGNHELKAVLANKEVSANIVIDNTEPAIEPSVADGKEYKGEFTIDAVIDDASEITEITAQLDGSYIALPYETSSALLEPGEHELVVTATDAAGNIGSKTVAFTVVEEDPSKPDESDNEAKATSANLSVRVNDPTNDKMDVAFYQSYQYTVEDTEDIVVSHNAVASEPPKSFLPEGEKRFTKDELTQLVEADGTEFSTESSTEFPYHRFDVTVDENVQPDDKVEIVWNGSSLEGRKVTMYAWNYTTETWQELVSTIAGNKTFELIGSVKAEEYVNDQKISVIVQDQIADPGENFTFVWMSDTQYYSESYPYIYKSQVNWIVENQDELNIEYVFHTGDLVNIYDDFTQWEVADSSMKVLDDAEIPYGVLAGNHDVDQKSNNYENYYAYFGDHRFKDRSYFGESYKNNRGHYDLISVNGNDFIMVYMGWGIDQDGIDWINQVLKKHPNRKAILSFHEYLLASGSRSPIGDEIFEKVVVPNNNVYAVLSGHYHNSQKLVDKIDDNGDGVADRTVYQLLADYQGGPEGGQGYLRLLNFNMETNQLEVQTYSPYMDDYNFYNPDEFPGKDEFQLDWDMTPQTKRVATDYVEVNVYTNDLIGTAENVPSGKNASVTWNELEPNDEYFWYVIATDQYGGNVRSDIWSFKTVDGEVVEPDVPGEPEVPGKPDDKPDPPGKPDDKPGKPGKPEDMPNNNKQTIKPTIQDNTATLSDDVFESVAKNGNIVIDLNELADLKLVEIELSTEQVKTLKDKNVIVTVEKGDVTLDIPASAFSGTGAVVLTIEQLNQVSNALSNVYDFTITQGGKTITKFAEGVTLSFKVDESKVNNPEDVNVFYLNEFTNEWEHIGGEFANGKVTSPVNHFSTFAVFENAVDTDNDEGNESPVVGKPSNNDGNDSSLPDTATNMYNYLVVGIVLIVVGTGLWGVAYYRRQRLAD